MTAIANKCRSILGRGMRRRVLFCALIAAFGSVASQVEASFVYGIQATTGSILTVDPATGAVVNSYATPDTISPTQGHAGLSYASPLGELLYFDSPTNFTSGTLYRLDPATGAVLSTASGDEFPNLGLSYQRSETGQDLIFYGHAMSVLDIHRQEDFGGAVTFFWGPNPHAGGPGVAGGLGGDGYGRLFAIYQFGQIGEIDPFENVNAFINTFAAPAGALGLAFDGIDLYVSTNEGQLLTLNPDTGHVLDSVFIPGGNLIELGAKLPEPATLALLGLGLAGLGFSRRKQ